MKPSKQMQTASATILQAILQMVHDPNKPGTAEDSIKMNRNRIRQHKIVPNSSASSTGSTSSTSGSNINTN